MRILESRKYKTVDGIKELQFIGDGLLQDPETFECYEKNAVKMVINKKIVDQWKLTVLYWTKTDIKKGSSSPSGRRTLYISKENSQDQAVKMVENRKEFRSTVYDVWID